MNKVLQIKYTEYYKKSKSKNKNRNKCFFEEQKCVLRNALKLYDKRSDIINAFIYEDIYSGDVERDVYYTPKDLESQNQNLMKVQQKE